MPPDNALVPTDVPFALQSPPFAVTSVGLHKKNSTVPVGAGDGATVAIVTLSSTDVPGITPDPVGSDVVVIADTCESVVKHSVVSLV